MGMKADIAMAFGWSPETMDKLTFNELHNWCQVARAKIKGLEFPDLTKSKEIDGQAA